MGEEKDTETWLKIYLENVHNERICALNKMDTTTDWSMGVTGLIVAAIFASFDYIEYSQYLTLVGIYFNMIFLKLECKRYAFFDKWLFLETKIENYFLANEGSLEDIIHTIKRYDLTPIAHGSNLRLNKKWRFYRRLNAFHKYPMFLLILIGLGISLLVTKNPYLTMVLLLLLFVFCSIILYGDHIKFKVFKEEHDPEKNTEN